MLEVSNEFTKENPLFLSCIISFLIICNVTYAKIYFYFDAEDQTVGNTLPIADGNAANFCQHECMW
jgi:hypothetical protein